MGKYEIANLLLTEIIKHLYNVKEKTYHENSKVIASLTKITEDLAQLESSCAKDLTLKKLMEVTSARDFQVSIIIQVIRLMQDMRREINDGKLIK